MVLWVRRALISFDLFQKGAITRNDAKVTILSQLTTTILRCHRPSARLALQPLELKLVFNLLAKQSGAPGTPVSREVMGTHQLMGTHQ